MLEKAALKMKTCRQKIIYGELLTGYVERRKRITIQKEKKKGKELTGLSANLLNCLTRISRLSSGQVITILGVMPSINLLRLHDNNIEIRS